MDERLGQPLTQSFVFKVHVNTCNVLRTTFKRSYGVREFYSACLDGIVYVVATSCEEAARVVGSSALSVERLGHAIS